MADSQAGLTNNGQTTNFDVSYDDSLVTTANVIDNANALLGVVENEFNVTTGWFGTPAGKFGPSHRQKVKLDLARYGDQLPRRQQQRLRQRHQPGRPERHERSHRRQPAGRERLHGRVVRDLDVAQQRQVERRQ